MAQLLTYKCANCDREFSKQPEPQGLAPRLTDTMKYIVNYAGTHVCNPDKTRGIVGMAYLIRGEEI